MADGQEQFAREESTGVSADDLARMKSRAEASEQVAQAEREARQKAEAERDSLAKERDAAHQRIEQEVAARVQADEVAITQAISAATSERDAAAKDLADALAANDAAAIAKAIDRQSTAKFEEITAQNQHKALQNWKQQQVQRLQVAEEARRQQTERTQPDRQRQQDPEPQRQQAQPQPGGQVDISGFPAEHQKWFRSHADDGLLDNNNKGHRLRNLVIADHYDAIERGLVEGTPSYYEFIEGAYMARKHPQREEAHSDQNLVADGMEINLETPNQDSGARVVRRDAPVRPAGARDHEVQTPAARQQTSAAALPPSRAATPANGNRDAGRVVLSLGEQEAARYSFPHLIKGSDATEAYKEYARNKVELQREGRL